MSTIVNMVSAGNFPPISQTLTFSQGVLTCLSASGDVAFALGDITSVRSLDSAGIFFVATHKSGDRILVDSALSSFCRFTFPGEESFFLLKTGEDSFLFELQDSFVVVDKTGAVLNRIEKNHHYIYTVSKNCTRNGSFAIHRINEPSYLLHFYNQRGEVICELRRKNVDFMFFCGNEIFCFYRMKGSFYIDSHIFSSSANNNAPQVIEGQFYCHEAKNRFPVENILYKNNYVCFTVDGVTTSSFDSQGDLRFCSYTWA